MTNEKLLPSVWKQYQCLAKHEKKLYDLVTVVLLLAF